MIEFRPLTYETLKVGEEFVSDEHLVTPEDIETYAFAVDDHHPWFFEDSPFGGPIAHPTLLGNQALRLRHSRYIVHAGLHAKMEFEFLEPIARHIVMCDGDGCTSSDLRLFTFRKRRRPLYPFEDGGPL